MVDYYRNESPSTLSLVLWFVGLVIILAAVWVLFTQTDLNRYVPLGVVVAILLLIIGIAVMATSDRFRSYGAAHMGPGGARRTETYERVGTYGASPPPPPYERREYREFDERERL